MNTLFVPSGDISFCSDTCFSSFLVSVVWVFSILPLYASLCMRLCVAVYFYSLFFCMCLWLCLSGWSVSKYLALYVYLSVCVSHESGDCTQPVCVSVSVIRLCICVCLSRMNQLACQPACLPLEKGLSSSKQKTGCVMLPGCWWWLWLLWLYCRWYFRPDELNLAKCSHPGSSGPLYAEMTYLLHFLRMKYCIPDVAEFGFPMNLCSPLRRKNMQLID